MIVKVVALISIFCCAAWSQKGQQKEGDKPYAPTRLEWLAVALNAQMRVDLTEQTGYGMSFVPLFGTNTILIYVRYLPFVERPIMNNSIDTAKSVISIESKSLGWSSWLKVNERVEIAGDK